MPITAKWIPFNRASIEALAIKESGVYEVGKALGNIVLYIGRSEASIRGRMLTHKGETRFRGCTHFRFRRANPDSVQKAEDRLLEGYKKQHGKYPPLNKNKSGDNYWKGILY